MSLQEKSTRLEGRRIAHCVTGSIAAIEAPRLARELRRHGAHVQAYMSKDATKIIHPYSMEFATDESVVTEITGGMEHLSSFDLVLVAPATASTISKMAVGIADGPVTALALATEAKIIVVPSMALRMYEKPLLQENLAKLKKSGCIFLEPRVEEGKAKLPAVEEVVEAVIKEFTEKDLKGSNVMVTAGPTVEYIDPIRVITNKSSGRMGIEMAKEAYRRGANVKLVYGLGSVKPPEYLNVTRVETTKEMLSAVMKGIKDCDVFVSAAAVADFTTKMAPKKIESRNGVHELKLQLTPKILDAVRKSRRHPSVLVAFKALDKNGEKELKRASEASLDEYGADVAVANDAPKTMGSEDAEVCIATKKGTTHIPLTSKSEVAKHLWDIVADLKGK
ncbi:MAG: bifunctional phosphopantothenoylcysteine decarboxylase/phosphopantothenate--cysteine ligase CoaBC [Candidatus Hydrothermarchaeales archaeon]